MMLNAKNVHIMNIAMYNFEKEAKSWGQRDI